MAKKRTHAELLAEVARLQRNETLHMLALQDALTESLQHVAMGERDGWLVVGRVSRLTSPHGGLLVTTWRTDGQRTTVHVAYLEDALSDRNCSGSVYPHEILDAAIVARQRALDDEREGE